MNLLKATGTIGGLTLVSRFAGLARDMLMATYVGAGMASDAFQIAWRLPNLFRALFAEGAFAAVFVPMFNRTISEGDADRLPLGRCERPDGRRRSECSEKNRAVGEERRGRWDRNRIECLSSCI